MKKLTVIATIITGMLFLSACNNSEVVVESKAGDITKDEFYNKLKDNVGESVLQQMVLEKVLDENYKVDEKEVDQQVEKYKKEFGDQFEMMLQQQGIPDEDAFREQIHTLLLYEEAVFGDVEITDDELKEKYDRMKTELKARHILVEDEKTAKEVKKKLDGGADFAKLAKEYSKDDGSAEKGGDVGWFTTGNMVPEFEDKAYSMKTGEISEPVKSQWGYHIIKLEDKREVEQDIGSFEDNKDKILADLRNEKVTPEDQQAKIDSLIKDAKIEVKDEQFKDLFKISDEGNEAKKEG